LRPALLKLVAVSALAVSGTLLLTSCETTAVSRPIAQRSLPAYEPPAAQSDFQTVRTTAYTHTESDHLTYGARNALGGQLRSAIAKADSNLRWFADDEDENITIALMTREKRGALAKKQARDKKLAKKAAKRAKHAKADKKDKKGKNRRLVRFIKPKPRIGSAAADWSRYPVGTTFRVLRTGQVYKVDDYGWALAGRNTIDLYMASKADMNRWGVRHEPIQVLSWGDRQASIALLRARAHYKHCRRMLLQLEGKHEEAAALL
jgi:3D (Asp-Asp-Asp) domain-containing protein